MSSITNTLKDVGVFLLIAWTIWIALFPVFWYIVGFFRFAFNLISLMWWSCDIYNISFNLTFTSILFILTTFVYNKWFK